MLKILNKLICVRWKYLLYGSYVYIERGSKFYCGKNVKIRKSKIHLTKQSMLVIHDNVTIYKTLIASSASNIKIGEWSRIYNGEMPIRGKIIVTNGNIDLGAYNRIRAQKIWVRFGGHFSTGNYININEYSEVRCDEFVKIGDFVEISYNVKIWDTNTHEFEPLNIRRERWKRLYLSRDVSEKPITKSVLIGNDVWIGERVGILKGTHIEDGCIVGFGTILSNTNIPPKHTVVNKKELRMIPNGL